MIVETLDRYLLVDVGSTHGTWLNGRRVRECDLHHGDTIQIGDTRFQFLDEASDEAPLLLEEDRQLSYREVMTYRLTSPDRATLFDNEETTTIPVGGGYAPTEWSFSKAG